MSSADEQKAISGSSEGRKRIRLDESTTSAKADIEMPAAHNKVKFFQTNFTFKLSRKEVPWGRDRGKANA